jgi:hypothetical protein
MGRWWSGRAVEGEGCPVWIGGDRHRDVGCFIIDMRPFSKGEDDTDEGKGC